ncbi:MAG: hypothetical protein NXH97_20020 [Rhodobacteraceae bacterium]|nr:hypothetical protein [Paracoccaceae bacterium]
MLISSRLADGSQVHEQHDVVTAIPPGCQFDDVRKINGVVVSNPLYRHVVAGDETPKRRTWARPLL